MLTTEALLTRRNTESLARLTALVERHLNPRNDRRGISFSWSTGSRQPIKRRSWLLSGFADLGVAVTEIESVEQPPPGVWGEPVGRAAQQPPDAEQWIIPSVAMPGRFVLDATADVIDRGDAEAGDVSSSAPALRPARCW